jgi:hypothetical protein
VVQVIIFAFVAYSVPISLSFSFTLLGAFTVDPDADDFSRVQAALTKTSVKRPRDPLADSSSSSSGSPSGSIKSESPTPSAKSDSSPKTATAKLSLAEASRGAKSEYFPIDGRQGYSTNKEQFHEFMVALIGMTVFDAVELWLFSKRSQDLYVVAAIHRDADMQQWTNGSKSLRLHDGQEVAGYCMQSSYPYWDHHYNDHDESSDYPRANLAKSIGVRTAFGVPLPGPTGSCGALVLYAKTEISAEPLMVTLV